jgi:hypothetical protein
MTIAINLDLACLPFMLVIVVYAISNIIVNSPRAFIVSQIDHIVWKVIFLLINFTCVNMIIWKPLIFKHNFTGFDMTEAKELIFAKLLPMRQQFTIFGIPLGV